MDMLPAIHPSNPNQVFNGIEVSFGIAPILSKLSELANLPNKPTWNLFLINIETLIRNRKDSDLNIKKHVENVMTDCTVLAQYISAFCNITLARSMDKQSAIVFYIPDYRNLPKSYLREKFPKGTDIFWKIEEALIEKINKDGYQEFFDTTMIKFAVVGKPTLAKKEKWPHVDLKELLSSIFKNDHLPSKDTLMISHIPLDFHLYRTFNKFAILESYTSAIKTVKDFGKKIINDDIPFNKYTHLLFGDKWYLKSQIPTKTKNNLKDIAKRERWNIIPDKAVLAALVKHAGVNSDIYIKPNI